jgi:UDP-sulfoquinovose synthase
MKVIIIGGDGFCGWPTSLHLANQGYEVTIVDNLSRRRIDEKLGTHSLTRIETIENRIKTASQFYSSIDFVYCDTANEVELLRDTIANCKPDAIVMFGEQRAAPYSMVDDECRRYTVDNNIKSTHNICSAVVDIDPSIHLVHLGTMGVYGYSDVFGNIPEGYLDITVNSTGMTTDILYPANPGSIYHMTKCLDQLIFQYYNKNWGIKVTDLHQGIVWGVNTPETVKDAALVNRFDFDGIYGTVLNRFLVQGMADQLLTVYGTGGQKRAFIHITDTVRCIQLAIESVIPNASNRVRIMNQVTEVFTIMELAELVSEKTGVGIAKIDNPRNELAENELIVANDKFLELGLDPITLNQGLLDDVKFLAKQNQSRFDPSVVLNSPKWN